MKRHRSRQTNPKDFFEKILGKEYRPQLSMETRQELVKKTSDPKTPLSELREIHEAIAQKYLSILDPKILEHQVKTLGRFADFKKNDTVLSLFSGPAVVESFVAKELIPEGRMVCIEHAHGMNKQAKIVRGRSKAKNMSFITGSTTSIPFKGIKFDKIIALQAETSNPANLEKTIKEARRLIADKPGAKFILTFTTYSIEATRTVTEIINYMDLAGFIPTKGVSFQRFRNNSESILVVATPKSL